MAGTEGVTADAVSTSTYASPARSLGDPGITPLSPSHVAKDSEANDAEEPSFLVVVAIDFGTTSSGYAYSFTKEPECIHIMSFNSLGHPKDLRNVEELYMQIQNAAWQILARILMNCCVADKIVAQTIHPRKRNFYLEGNRWLSELFNS